MNLSWSMPSSIMRSTTAMDCWEMLVTSSMPSTSATASSILLVICSSTSRADAPG